MFTGLIEHHGSVVSNSVYQSSRRLIIHADFDDVEPGESIAVNGVCLTVLPDKTQGLAFDVSPETLSCTNLSDLHVADTVHLERAMMANKRFGGHIVSGHVDCTAILQQLTPVDDCMELSVGGFLESVMRYLVPKGSITLNGVNLTINHIDTDSITLLLIPHTIALTTLANMPLGTRLNVEFDYFSRIIAHQLQYIQGYTHSN